MNQAITMAGAVALLILVGTAFGLTDRKTFSLRWLLIAAGLVALNCFLNTRGFFLLPNLLPAARWSWEGKILALAATLGLASLPAFGWRASGLTLAQAKGSLKVCVPVALLYCLFFALLALIFPDHGANSPEHVDFELSMPGLEEEPFWRGVLLLVLGRAFAGRLRVLGVEWGWGDILACMMFGLLHALRFSDGRFTFNLLAMALSGLPSLVAVWVRLRSGSVLIPVLLHNYGNAISMFL